MTDEMKVVSAPKTAAKGPTKRVTLRSRFVFQGKYYGPGENVEVPADFPDPQYPKAGK